MRKQLQQLLLVSFIVFAIFQLFSLIATFTGGERISSATLGLHVGILIAAILYGAYTQQRIHQLKEDLLRMQKLWQCLPFAIVMKKDDKISFANDNFHRWADKSAAEKIISADKSSALAEPMRQTEHYVVLLNKENEPAYTAEVIVDLSAQAAASKQREEEYINMLKILVNLFEMKDLFNKGHSQVVSDLAQELARKLGLGEQQIKVITQAAILHDIGKIIIPADILNKTAPLTPEDYDTIYRHSSVSADIVEAMTVFQEAGPIIRHHHERFDGQGYPAGLAGQEIPLGSRILAVVDAFDAMTAGRTYRGKIDAEAAVAVLNAERGKQFDPQIVDAFSELVYSGRMKPTEK